MADDVADFLQQTKTDVEAVQYSGSDAFNRVWIVPAVDLDTVLKIPRFPMALINDAGGELSPVNGKVWTRQMDITILDVKPRDHAGEQGTIQILNLGEALVAALEWNRTDGLFLAADSDVEAVTVKKGLMIFTKTYTFQYQIQRS